MGRNSPTPPRATVRRAVSQGAVTRPRKRAYGDLLNVDLVELVKLKAPPEGLPLQMVHDCPRLIRGTSVARQSAVDAQWPAVEHAVPR